MGLIHVPAELRSLCSLARVDYIDLFTLAVPAADAWTAEQWARAMFEDDRTMGKRVLRRGLAGLLVGRSSDAGQIGPALVLARAPAWLRTEESSRLTTDQVILSVRADRVSMITAIQYERPAARPVWSTISNLHRWLAPRVLRQGHDRLQRPEPVDGS